ncbi:acyl-CoA N-acyltransferase [Umbelopsis sp. PMI_123]|nr:acyl-CoA N-acyltransferase [Umbelopsis sp. PMI_123]
MQEKPLGENLYLRFADASYNDRIEDLVADTFVRQGRSRNVALASDWRRTATNNGQDENLTAENTLMVVLRESDDSDQVVAITSLWKEIMIYEGIKFNTARPEIVCVHKDYRGKNLMKHLFNAWHEQCDLRGYLVQTIVGIENYYRQFGYEYAFDYMKMSSTLLAAIPALAENQTEPLTFRAATIDDADALMRIAQSEYAGLSVVTLLPHDWLVKQILIHQDVIHDPSPKYNRRVICFTDMSNELVGFVVVVVSNRTPPQTIPVLHVSVDCNKDISLFVASMLRGIVKFYEGEVAPEEFSKRNHIEWLLSPDIPFLQSMPPSSITAMNKLSGDAKYVRVPKLAAFINILLPALNNRLEQSLRWRAYTGSVKVASYSTRYPGFEMRIQNGVIVRVEEFIKRDQNHDDELARFPDRTFLQVLFGRRSVTELNYILPDVIMEDPILDLLSILFPKTNTLSYHYD